ncbi:MAG: FG-GAP-like repeat-containing protein [Myxococcota bacterium]
MRAVPNHRGGLADGRRALLNPAFALCGLLMSSVSCSGQLTVDLNSTPCTTAADCSTGECISGFCSDGTGSGSGNGNVNPGPGGGGSNNNNNSPDEATLATGDPCTRNADCTSGRCQQFDDALICTESCTSDCPSNLVCFTGLCVPQTFCENESNAGSGPGCDGSPCESCGSNERCQSRGVGGGFECACQDGFVRREGVCEADPCSPNPCQNAGFCQTITGVSGAVCSCADLDEDGTADFDGSFCENPIARCPATTDDNPCQNGGTCVNRLRGIECVCPTGFVGDNCEENFDDCAEPRCVNGGTCTDLVGGFECTCPDGFTGNRCQVVEGTTCAESDPCENGGTCVDPPMVGGDVNCDCSGVDFSGDFCSLPIDDCAGVTCQNGSVCVDGVRDYVCDNCPFGFTGKDCDAFAPCADDDGCAVDQFCNGGTCDEDNCDPAEARSCSGRNVQRCAANGSGLETLFTCSPRQTVNGTLAFDSTCETPASGDAFCTCEDDWDCPANTVCDVDQCVGTGQPATCSLPAEPFENVLPTQEIEWGSPEGGFNNNALRSAPPETPFPFFTQVVMSPVVANLDDDNGDGLIDERDFPEIIFLTFCWPPDGRRDFRDFVFDGVLRVIHGGGTDPDTGQDLKGRDYLAVCGDTVWREGDDLSGLAECECTIGDRVTNNGVQTNQGQDDSGPNAPRLDPTMSPAVADLDGDGVPEIIVHTESNALEVYDNRGGLLATSRDQTDVSNGAVTVANVDNDGFAEIIMGRNVNALSINGDVWEFTDYYLGSGQRGGLSQGPAACVADLAGDDNLEIIGGSTVYRVPIPSSSDIEQGVDCGTYPAGSDDRAYCNEDLVVVWDRGENGFCAVADVWGADLNAPPGPDNPLDGTPEVILIGAGEADSNNNGGWLTVYAADGTPIEAIDYDAAPFSLGDRGGAPNVDDFDGDGFPEVGTAFSAGYGLSDFQAPSTACPQWTTRLASDPAILAGGLNDPNPARSPGGACSQDSDCTVEGTTCNEGTGQCICLHNSWIRQTEDDSSELTGSSVFDFNGDGAAEVVYNDECEFRVYDGLNGNVLFNEFSESRTRIEYPVVSDIDNDGNAEIVFGTSNESGFCSDNEDARYNAGVEVWGDAGDFWVSARRTWNQHAYHVTNITENSQVPRFEPKGWRPAEETNGRDYNTYRSNPRNFGVAPDLTVPRVQIVSGGGGCGGTSVGATGTFVSQISNEGDLRVGPGVVVGFEGDFGDGFITLLNAGGGALVTVVENTLEPLDSLFLSIEYDAAWNGESQLPNVVRVTVDVSYDANTETVVFDGGAERECIEVNNSSTGSVTGSGPVADLVLQVEVTTCDEAPFTPTITARIANQGNAPAPGTVVRFFAGNPNQGGTPIGEREITAEIAAGAENLTVTFQPTSFEFCTPVKVFAVVDPDNAVAECNDGNNLAGQSGSSFCCPDTGG